MKTCWQVNNLAFPIKLLQHGKNNFSVVYGRQIDRNLDYGRTATKLGEAILHALACEGKLDNSEGGE